MGLPRLLLVENDPYYIYLLECMRNRVGLPLSWPVRGWGLRHWHNREEARCVVLESDLPEVSVGGPFKAALRAMYADNTGSDLSV